MRVYPLVSVGHASAANGRLGEPSIRHVVLPPLGVEQAQTAGSHAFPAGVIELTSEVPCAFERFGRHVTLSGREVEFSSKGLRPRQERHPTFFVYQLDRLRYRRSCLAALTTEQVRARDQ